MPINSNHMGLFGIQQKPSLSALLDVVCLNHTKGCGFTEFTGVHYDHQTPLRPAENSFLEVTQSVARGIETGQGASLFRGTNFSTMISHPVFDPVFSPFFPRF